MWLMAGSEEMETLGFAAVLSCFQNCLLGVCK